MLLALTACGSGDGASGSGKVKVVASTNFYGNIVQQVGGDRVDVTSIISDPDTDPHEYESSAKNAAAVSEADLLVDNGLGYDDFMSKLADNARSSVQTVTAAKVLGISGADANPHLWYAVERMPKVADAIATALGKADPDHKGEYTANAAKFDKSLQPLISKIDQIKAAHSGTKVAYTERVPGYLIQEAGLKLGIPASFASAVEEGNDPSPSDTAAFNTALKTRAVKVLFYNGQVTDSETVALKKQAAGDGVPVVAVTETMPTKAKSYQAWQLAQINALSTALESDK